MISQIAGLYMPSAATSPRRRRLRRANVSTHFGLADPAGPGAVLAMTREAGNEFLIYATDVDHPRPARKLL